MKKCIILLFIVSFFSAKADIHFFDLTDYEKDTRTKEHIDFLFDYFHTFANWTNDWQEKVPRDSIIDRLKKSYAAISETKRNTADYYMLLGDVSSYLYNLDANDLQISTEELYGKAIALAPKDYRPYWFCGMYLSTSARPVAGIEMFRKAAELATSKTPDQFWAEYAWAAHSANMPATSVFAMEMVKRITGAPSYFETMLGAAIRSKLMKSHRDSTYADSEIWDIDPCDTCNQRFIYSTMLGMGVRIDTSWGFSTMQFEKGGTMVQIFPKRKTNSKGEMLPIKFMVIAYVPDSEDSLHHLTDGFLDWGEYKPFEIPSARDFPIKYVLSNSKNYPEFGGGKLVVLAKECRQPEFPGSKLEMPKPLPQSEPGNGDMKFYTPKGVYKRMSDRIQYVVILDTCEEFYAEALEMFRNMLGERLVFE